MTLAYTSRAKLPLPPLGYRGWNVPLNAGTNNLDGYNGVGALCVMPAEIPSATLNIDVASGPYRLSNGQVLDYAGGSATLTANATVYVWLDETGTLTTGTAYPTGTWIAELGVVTTGATNILSIADGRVMMETTGGTIAAGYFYGGPATGSAAAPQYRAIVNTDVPQTLTHAWITDFTATVEAIPISSLAAATAPINFGGQTGINAGTPVNPTDLATKQYVDLTIAGFDQKPTATVATAAALPANTYANGTSGVGATLTGTVDGALTVDGVAVAAGALVLVKNEATQANNGLYVVTATGSVSAVYVLTRQADMNAASEFDGALVPVGPGGTANANTIWLCTTTGTVTVGTTAITFVDMSPTVGTVQNTDGTITVTASGTTITIAVNLSHANTWTGAQTFTATLTAGAANFSGTVDFTGAVDFTGGVTIGSLTGILCAASGVIEVATLGTGLTFVGTTLEMNPAGSDGEIQVNVAGAFGAYANLSYDGHRLTVPGRVTTWQQFTPSGSGPSTITIDWSLGDHWYGTLVSGVNDITYTNVPAAGTGQTIRLRLTQPSSGASATVSWPAGTKWPSGTAASLSTSNGFIDLLTVTLDPSATRYETFLAGTGIS